MPIIKIQFTGLKHTFHRNMFLKKQVYLDNNESELVILTEFARFDEVGALGVVGFLIILHI